MTEPQITQTLKEMLTQREYKIESETEDFIIAVKPDDQKVCAFLNIAVQFGVKSVGVHIGLLTKMGITHGIIVYTKMTPAVNKLLINTTELKMTIEAFQDKDVRYNLTKHSLVPEHTRVPDAEAKILKKQYMGGKFPTIKITDPIVKFFAFKRGSIIKVVRKSGFVAYRVVR